MIGESTLILHAVRVALREEYGDAVQIYRARAHYYYFDGERGIDVPSLITNSLRGYSVAEIMEHVATALAKIEARQ